MKTRYMLIVLSCALVLSWVFFFWKTAQYTKKQAVTAKKRPVSARVAAIKEKAKAVPEAIKRYKEPKIAIVLDDFGYNMNNTERLFSIKEPVTLSILPDLPYSTRVANLARENGRETILHLPLESHRPEAREEADTIRSGMSEKEVKSRLAAAIASIPGLKGVSNHQGSKSTEDRILMTVILTYLKEKGLFFLDSLTSDKSVCRDVAGVAGVRFARRDIFLDNSNQPADIEKQVLAMKKLALKKGRVVAIGHDRKNTIEVLARMMPELSGDGIKFVPLSELARR